MFGSAVSISYIVEGSKHMYESLPTTTKQPSIDTNTRKSDQAAKDEQREEKKKQVPTVPTGIVFVYFLSAICSLFKKWRKYSQNFL